MTKKAANGRHLLGNYNPETTKYYQRRKVRPAEKAPDPVKGREMTERLKALKGARPEGTHPTGTSH